jgi:hypothetical protein
MDELCIALNNMRITSRLHDKGACECLCMFVCFDLSRTSCGASLKVYTRLTDLWESVVCLKGDMQEWHAK